MMLHVDPGHGVAGSAKVAADLAGRFGSALIGVCSALSSDLPIAYRDLAEIASKNANASQLAGLMNETELAFRRTAIAVSRVFWWSSFDLPTSALLQSARGADLIIASRNKADDPTAPPSFLDIDQLVLQAGRPLLLLPPETDHLSVSRVLVACTDTRESRRTIRDAVPFLQKANDVILIEACQKGEENAALDRLSDMKSILADMALAPA